MDKVWMATASLVLALLFLLGAGMMGSMGLAVFCGFWAVGSVFWLIMVSFFTYVNRL